MDTTTIQDEGKGKNQIPTKEKAKYIGIEYHGLLEQ